MGIADCSNCHLQGQGFRRVEIFEGSMDDIHQGMQDMMRELQGAFSFGFGMFPELEEHMTGEMRRLFRPEASTSGRCASSCENICTSQCSCEEYLCQGASLCKAECAECAQPEGSVTLSGWVKIGCVMIFSCAGANAWALSVQG